MTKLQVYMKLCAGCCGAATAIGFCTTYIWPLIFGGIFLAAALILAVVDAYWIR